MMGFENQIAVAVFSDHGQVLTRELGRALQIQTHVSEEPQAEPGGEELARHVHFAAKHSRALIGFRNIRNWAAGNECKA
jgi:hypothetical protein